MPGFELMANLLVIGGAIILVVTALPLRQLMASLREGTLGSRGYTMTLLIVVFVVGYLSYVAAYWFRYTPLLDLIVPAVFFLAACFVWLTARLSLQAAIDKLRVALLEKQTVTDPLTGVYNRRFLDGRLAEEFARARRYGTPLSIIFLDIDHFKKINDTHGHKAGDQVLAATAKLLGAGLREMDIVARFGGEEFVIVAPHTPLAGATEVAVRLLKAVETHDFNVPAGNAGLRVTCSAGVASVDADMTSSNLLVGAADRCLYRAKHDGRNRVVNTAQLADAADQPTQ